MNKAARWLVSFDGVVIVLGIIVACVIAFGPLVQESFARRTWTATPCEINPEGTRYHFLFNGQRYYSARMNFWQVRASTAERAAGTDALAINGQCFVSGSSKPSAVLRLDAAEHPDQGVGFFTCAGLILSACAFLVVSNRRVTAKRRRAS